MARDPRSMEQIFFEALQLHFQEAGHTAQLTEVTPERPFSGLLAELPDFGKEQESLVFEMSCPPGLSDPDGGAFLLQTFVTVARDFSADQLDALLWLTARLNTQLAIGAFGVMEDHRLTYYKMSLIIDAKAPAGAQVRQLDLQVGLMIHMLHTFFDLINEVSEGANPGEALGDHPLGKVFAQAN